MVMIAKPDKTTPDWISDARLYLDKDGKVVGEKDPAKLTLLVAKGGSLPFAIAQRHGLIPVAPVEVEAIEVEPIEAAPVEIAETAPEFAEPVVAIAPEPKPAPKPQAKKKK